MGFNKATAIELVTMIARNVENITRLQLLDLCYQTDRLHLSMLGRVITGAAYSVEGGGKQLGSEDLLPLIDSVLSSKIEQVDEIQPDKENIVLGSYGDAHIEGSDLSASDEDAVNLVVDLFLNSQDPDYTSTYPAVSDSKAVSLEDIVKTIPGSDDLRQYLFG